MRITTVLYGTAIFLGAFLLFLVEPMAAKRLLPLLGGSAAVWTTCLVFFQTALLLGYLLAHWLATKFEPRVQALVYIGLLVASLAQAFINLHPNLHASTGRPIASVFQVLSVLIGLPFLVLSATNPLLQSWYARLAGGTESGGLTPPYRLFSLSNLGSLLALIAYPSLLEPYLSLHAQNLIWVAGLLVLVIASLTIRARSAMPVGQSEPTIDPAAVDMAEKTPSHGDRALWLLLPACGSLLLCSFTNHLSQNIAAIPLLWIIPLIAYLMSFVVAFNGSRWYPRSLVHCLLMPVLLMIGYLLYQRNTEEGFIYKLIPHISSPRIAVPIFCGALFLACLFCHGELYRLRPSPRYATSYYLMIAAGGALGAIFVGVAAPLIFSAYYELDVALVLTGMLALVLSRKDALAWIVLWSVVVAGSLTLAILEARAYGEYNLAQVRSFYGAMRVTTADFGEPGEGRSLFHGTIEHGAQLDLQPNLPTTYYAEDSGVGMALRLCCGDRPRRVGIIGLGAGTVAAYGRKGDLFRFYEINPQMVKISAEFFTFVHDSAATVEIEMGDARLSLEKEPPQNYDVLVVDAFSGDAIPVHLLTREAFALYRRHLQPNGIIAIHISNQFLDLGPEVKQQAELAGMTAVLIPSYDDDSKAEYEADWVLVTANQGFLKETEVSDPKGEIKIPRRLRPWTDDYNSLLPLLK